VARHNRLKEQLRLVLINSLHNLQIIKTKSSHNKKWHISCWLMQILFC